MAKIYRYQKVTDAFTTHSLRGPDFRSAEEESRVTELGTIDGFTYVSVPDGVVLPEQTKEIALVEITLTEEVGTAIKAASPHVALINARVVSRIREKYSVDDEFKMLRVGPSPETEAYNDHVEACRSWGRAEKTRLGLTPTPLKEAWLTAAKNPGIFIPDVK